MRRRAVAARPRAQPCLVQHLRRIVLFLFIAYGNEGNRDMSTTHSDGLEAALLAIAEKVRRLRTKRGWDQRQLAKFVGTSHSRISNLESGKANPTLATLIRIADCFGVSLEYLVREKK